MMTGHGAGREPNGQRDVDQFAIETASILTLLLVWLVVVPTLPSVAETVVWATFLGAYWVAIGEWLDSLFGNASGEGGVI